MKYIIGVLLFVFITKAVIAVENKQINLNLEGALNLYTGYFDVDEVDGDNNNSVDAFGVGEITFNPSKVINDDLEVKTFLTLLAGDEIGSEGDSDLFVDKFFAQLLSKKWGTFQYGYSESITAMMHKGSVDVSPMRFNSYYFSFLYAPSFTNSWRALPVSTELDSSLQVAKLAYVTPKIWGMSVGLEYITSQDKVSFNNEINSNASSGWPDEMSDGYAISFNYSKNFGTMNVDFSVGHMILRDLLYNNGGTTSDGSDDTIGDQKEFSSSLNLAWNRLHFSASYRDVNAAKNDNNNSDYARETSSIYSFGVAYHLQSSQISASYLKAKVKEGANDDDLETFLFSYNYKLAEGIDLWSSFHWSRYNPHDSGINREDSKAILLGLNTRF